MASRRQHRQQRQQRSARLLDGLLHDHRDRLLHQARFHSEGVSDAEDALADACVQILRFFDGVTDEHALRWMLVVVKRCAWAISRRRRERASLLEAVPREEIQGEPCRGPVELLEVAEEVREFGAALDELKPDERRALALLALGYSYREIAESQGWTRTKVNRCLAEGRARLRRLLAEGGESQ